MKRKLKLKKSVLIFFIIFLLIIIGSIYGYKEYQKYLYTKTYEYKLTEHGYTIEEAKFLEDNFSEERLQYFLTIEKNLNLISFRKETYFLDKNLEKYLDYYSSHSDLPLKDIVAIVNTHRDKDYYAETFDSDVSLDTQMIINKYYKLNKDFSPSDITSISSKYAWGENGSKKTREITYSAYLEMYEAAKNDGINLMINSSYRTYEEQESVYNQYDKKYGQEYADEIAARPGHSEHQSGLALDIFCLNNSNTKTFKDSESYQWLLNNAYKYGFILRYPEGKENITGFTFESWHYRYVGKEIAKYIYENDITYDEYYAYFIEKTSK